MQYAYNWDMLFYHNTVPWTLQSVYSPHNNVLNIHIGHKWCKTYLHVLLSVIGASVICQRALICLCSLSGSVDVMHLPLRRGLWVGTARKAYRHLLYRTVWMLRHLSTIFSLLVNSLQYKFPIIHTPFKLHLLQALINNPVHRATCCTFGREEDFPKGHTGCPTNMTL